MFMSNIVTKSILFNVYITNGTLYSRDRVIDIK